MAISQSALRELKRELVNLRQSRKGIDGKIHGIELILSASRPLSREPGAKRHRSNGTEKARARAETDGSARGISLRQQIIEVLQEAPGSKPEDVAEAVSGKGFRVRGATSLRDRVAHELRRLRRMKIVRKRRGGRYVVAANTRPKDPTDRLGSAEKVSVR